MIYSFRMYLFWFPHCTQHRWHVELLSMITPRLSIKCLFVFSDLPRSPLTTLHQTYTFQLCLANSVSTILGVAVSISRLMATCDSHCLHLFYCNSTQYCPHNYTRQWHVQCFVTVTSLSLPNNAVPWHEAGKCSQFLQYPTTSSLSPFQWGHHVTQATSYSFFLPPNFACEGASIVTHTLLTHSKLTLLIASQSISIHLTCHGTIYTMVFTIQVANFGLWCSLNILIVVSIISLPWQFRYFQPSTPKCLHFSFCYVP
jgi:hypothetical protein